MKIHVCLVSGQPTPNIVPILDPETRPELVILVVSPSLEKRADNLKQVIISQKGVKAELWKINDAFDFQQLENQFLELISEYEHHDIMLNLTGGTKLMSLAAHSVFHAEDKRIFYVHPQTDHLLWIHPKSQASQAIADRIKIPAFLQAHGAQITSKREHQVSPELREYANTLIEDVAKYGQALSVLNHYAGTAKNNLISEKIAPRHKNYTELHHLIDDLKALSLLTHKDNQLHFSDENARFFVNGGWLEQWVFSAVNQLKKEIPSIQDTACSVELMRDQNVKNELDIVILANNRLYIIECKSKTYRASNNDANESLYKLDSLADVIGGLQSNAMLLSYQALDKYPQQRAESLKINLVSGSQLQHLKSHIKKWLTPHKINQRTA